MASGKDDFGALLVGGLLGVGIGLMLASSTRDENERRRNEFRARLQQALYARGLALIAATLGRGPNNQAFWDITLQWPTGDVSRLRVPLPATVSPYSAEAEKFVLANVQPVIGYAHG